MRQPDCAHEHRIYGDDRKKVRASFRWRLTQEGQSEWLRKLAHDNPGEADFIEVPEQPADAKIEPWHGLYFRAWEALRFDRFYGAFGGEGPISYTAISRYAADHGIGGDHFGDFLTFLQAIDAEWLDWRSEKEKRP
ncbi:MULTISPECIES: hypothetical protein [unclassified Ensifer]|uniref:hypothetical protein n=1 Tax=unclassified Ensifer TaxID=2633371 RepID=UPI0011128380|nr:MULTISPECIES: hypothetical protein [unclassified Ensifer]